MAPRRLLHRGRPNRGNLTGASWITLALETAQNFLGAPTRFGLCVNAAGYANYAQGVFDYFHYAAP